MGSVFSKSKYVSVDAVNPFTVTLEPDFLAVPDGVSTNFTIFKTDDETIFAEIEGTLNSGVLTVDTIRSSTTDPLPVFSGGCTILTSVPADIFDAGQGTGRDAIVIMGQSNASGQNGVEVDVASLGWDEILDRPDQMILQLRKSDKYTLDHFNWLDDAQLEDKYVIATEPLDHAEDSGSNAGAVYANSVGFGLTIARQYIRDSTARGTRQVAILPCAKGGTALVSGFAEWASPSGSMYTYAVGVINEFLAENPDNRISMFVFQQGEADALSGTLDPFEWGAAALQIITDFRDNITLTPTARQPDLSKVPFLLGGIKITGTSNQIQHAADIQTIVSTTPYTSNAIQDTANWNYFEFGLHIDAPGQRAFGKIFYDAYRASLINLEGLPALPGQVQNLQATQDPGVVHLTWDTLVTIPALSFYSEQHKETSQGDEFYTTVENVSAGTTNLDVSGLTNGTDYTFRVFGVNTAGNGPFALVTKTPEVDTVPTAVQNFAGVSSETGIQLSWDALVYDPVVTGYTIQRKLDGAGSYNPIDDIDIAGQSTVAHIDTDVVASTTYNYRMFAINGIGDGANSTEITVTSSGSATLALNPYLWLRKGIDLTVNGNSVDWLDQSGKGNNAIPVASREVAIIDGGIFTLSDGRLEVPEDARLHEDGYTIVARVKTTKTGTRALFGLSSGIWVGQGLTDRLRAQGNSSLYASPDPFFVNGVEKTFAVTHSGTEANFYEGSTFTNTVAGTLQALLPGVRYLGAWNDFTGQDWDGYVYDIAVFRTVLTQPDIAAVIAEFPA